jgi:hypothetical protein
MSVDFSAARGWFIARREELKRAAEARAEEERAQREAQREAQRREAQRKARREARRRAREAPRSHAMVTRGQVRALLAPAVTAMAVDSPPAPALPRVRKAVAEMHGLGRCVRCNTLRSTLEFSSRSRLRECLPCALAQHDANPLASFARGLVRDAHTRAARVGIPIDIDEAWVCEAFEAARGNCALCGRRMQLERARKRSRDAPSSFFRFPWNASLDQREPRAGYTRTNTQLAHLRCNLAKAETPQADFVEMCRAVVLHLGQPPHTH